jgi:hypothetical protein
MLQRWLEALRIFSTSVSVSSFLCIAVVPNARIAGRSVKNILLHRNIPVLLLQLHAEARFRARNVPQPNVFETISPQCYQLAIYKTIKLNRSFPMNF